MENATKALLIAGGIFLALLTVVIGIFIKVNLTKISDAYVEKLELTELEKYNTYFEVYEGKTDITAQEILTLANIAAQKGYGTTVTVGSKELGSEVKENDFLSGTLQKTFKCKEIYYFDDERRVSNIVFEEKLDQN